MRLRFSVALTMATVALLSGLGAYAVAQTCEAIICSGDPPYCDSPVFYVGSCGEAPNGQQLWDAYGAFNMSLGSSDPDDEDTVNGCANNWLGYYFSVNLTPGFLTGGMLTNNSTHTLPPGSVWYCVPGAGTGGYDYFSGSVDCNSDPWNDSEYADTNGSCNFTSSTCLGTVGVLQLYDVDGDLVFSSTYVSGAWSTPNGTGC